LEKLDPSETSMVVDPGQVKITMKRSWFSKAVRGYIELCIQIDVRRLQHREKETSQVEEVSTSYRSMR